jgi:hypothetical protein
MTMDKPVNVCVLVGSLRKSLVQQETGEGADLARTIFDEARYRRDRAIAALQ